MQLRFAWGGATIKQWHGTITVNRGSVNLVRLLSEEPDAPGSVWNESSGVEIRQPAPRRWDAIDISVTAPTDAVLQVVLHNPTVQNAAPVIQEIPLRELLNKPINRELDQDGNRLSIRRLPFDLLHVKTAHDRMVFSPGDSLKFEVEPRLLPVGAGTALQLRARLVSAFNAQEVSSQEQAIKTTAEGAEPQTTSWKFRLPETEGVYDVVIEAIEQALWRLPKAKQIAERRIQLVVIADQIPDTLPEHNVSWTRVMEIDPANPAWYQRFRSWSLFPGLRQGPLGNGGMQSWQHPSLGPMARLKEQRPDQEAYWEAYPLSISRPGVPHILEVEYPSDMPQTLGVSIVEPNAAGWVVPIGLDSGFFVVEDPAADAAAQLLRHRVIFWPRTGAPMVLLSNRSQTSPGVYGKIRVLTGPNKLPPMFPVGEPSQRLLAGMMSRPLLPENFGAAESLDPTSGRSLDDWRAFYWGATRLAEYLRHVGYNAQMLTVLGEGSSIYPSRHLQPTQQYDTGESFETGQDLVRKDALEMTLRVFDRENVKLIPALRFNALLPELEERLRRGGPQAEGIRLIGSGGQEFIEKSQPFSNAVPRYNPLNPHVQEAMLDVIRELVQRYGSHPSFAGLALELSADSSTHLPGEGWGLDDDTMARFAQATNVKVPGEGPARFAQRSRLLAPVDRARFIVSPEHAQWLEWRAQVLADFYRRIQAELTTVRRDAVLYLAASNVLDGHEAQKWLRPTLPPKARVDEVLWTLGLRPDLLRQDRGLIFLRPQRVLPPGSVADQGILVTVNQSADLDAVFNRLPATGSLLLHDPLLLYNSKQARLTSFEAKSPYGKDKTVSLLFSHLSPSARQNRERFVHALATLDAEAIFDGGWLQPLGQEESLIDFITTFHRIPAGKFDTHPDSKLPVTIRTSSDSNSTYAYFVNDSQWPTTVELQVSAPAGCQVAELSGRRRLPAFNPGAWQIQLDPFDVVAVQFLSPQVKITKAQLLPNAPLQAWLTQRKRDFLDRIAVLSTPPPLSVLGNSNFEAPAVAGQIPGWSLLNPASGTLKLVPEGDPGPENNPIGNQALHFKGNGPLASLRSEPFKVPPSRRILIVVWLRVEDANRQPPLQLVVEDGRGYRTPGALGLGAANIIGNQWSPYSYSLKELPIDGSTQLRFGIDMTGPGEVSIDDVEMIDLEYATEERLCLSDMALLTDSQLLGGKLGECARGLDGYWPRFLIAHVPLPNGVAQRPEPAAATDPNKQPEKSATKSTRPLDKLFKRF